MLGFPTHIVGTPTIRGSFDFAQDKKARGYKDGEKIKIDQLLGRKGGLWHSPSFVRGSRSRGLTPANVSHLRRLRLAREVSPGLTPWANVWRTYGASLLRPRSSAHGTLRYATHFMVSFLRFLAQARR